MRITSRSVPAQSTYKLSLDYFRGVDMTDNLVAVDAQRACNGENMVRHVPGQVRKRMGFYTVGDFQGQINGIYGFGSEILIHHGTTLSKLDGTQIQTGLNNGRSAAVSFDMMDTVNGGTKPVLVILDGKAIQIYDGATCQSAENLATVPTIVISKDPEGGGEQYDPINMLSRKRIESFYAGMNCTATTTVTGTVSVTKTLFTAQIKDLGTYTFTYNSGNWKYNDETVLLAAYGIVLNGTPSEGNTITVTTAMAANYHLENPNATNVSVKKMVVNGDDTEWVDVTNFTVANGIVTFATAPEKSPIIGEDNVEITYEVDNEEYRNRANKCRFGITYGVNGATDRVFISGNDDHGNWDWWSDIHDPTFFGDIWYSSLGQGDSPITGYSIIQNSLATHKLNDDNGRNVYVRIGRIDTYTSGDNDSENENDEVVFPISTIIQGDGAVNPYCFGFSKEPIFLTKTGICATTPYVYNSERYVQNRSFFINAPLKEEDLSSAVATVYKEFYMLFVNNRVYILDTMQKSSDKAYNSEFQYEAYYWTGIPAKAVGVIDDRLYFGDDSGKVYCFFDNPENKHSYSDYARIENGRTIPGRPISARWDFDFSGQTFYRNKVLDYLAVSLSPFAHGALNVWIRKNDEWKEIIQSTDVDFFDFANIDFGHIVFGTNRFPRTIYKRIHLGKIPTERISLRNSEINSSFSFYAIGAEYSEGRWYRGQK